MGSLTLLRSKVPEGYFSRDVIDYIGKQVTRILKKDFIHSMTVDEESILRVLQRVLDDRLESFPKMITRAIMEIVNEIKTFELERNKHLRYEKYFTHTQKIYDVSSKSGPDMQIVKLSRQPATLRFYHTFGT
jgi:hypothetical protein